MPELGTPVGSAETPATPPGAAVPSTPTPNTPAATSPTLFAGKFKDPANLEAGFTEIVGKLGLELPKDRKLVGTGGLYTDHGALEHAYTSHEKMLGKIGNAKPAEPKIETPATPATPATDSIKIGGADKPIVADDDVPATLGKMGLKFEDVAAQFDKEGKFTDEQYAKFAAAGYPKKVADFMGQGMKAQAEVRTMLIRTAVTEAQKLAGGQAELDNLLVASKSFVPPEQHADFNARLKNPSTTVAAVEQLLWMQSKHNGTSNSRPLISGSAPATGSSNAPKTLAEFNALADRAINGDRAAAAIVKNTDPTKLR